MGATNIVRVLVTVHGGNNMMSRAEQIVAVG